MEIQEKVKTVLENSHTTQFILSPTTAMPDCYHKSPLKPPPTTGEERPICRLCFGYLERLGGSAIWEVIIHSHRLASLERQGAHITSWLMLLSHIY